jgi:ArsR family transcriptional regulator
MAQLLKDAGFIAAAPLALDGGELVVKIWTAKRRAGSVTKTPATLTETV